MSETIYRYTSMNRQMHKFCRGPHSFQHKCSKCNGLGHDNYCLICHTKGHCDVTHLCDVCGLFGHSSSEHCPICTQFYTREKLQLLKKRTLHRIFSHICSNCGCYGHDVGFPNCKFCESPHHCSNLHPCDKCGKLGHSKNDHCDLCDELHTTASHTCSKCGHFGHEIGKVVCSFCDSLEHCNGTHKCDVCSQLGHTSEDHDCMYCTGLHTTADHPCEHWKCNQNRIVGHTAEMHCDVCEKYFDTQHEHCEYWYTKYNNLKELYDKLKQEHKTMYDRIEQLQQKIEVEDVF